jgi:hypothetical protein
VSQPDGLDRTSTFGRAGWTGSGCRPTGWIDTASCPTDWIEQAYLSVEHSIRISAHTKISGWAINPRVGRPILSDGLDWTSNPVRRIGLGGQLLSEPEPWTSSGALALGLGFGSCPSGRVGLKKSVPTQPDGHTMRLSWVHRCRQWGRVWCRRWGRGRWLGRGRPH